MAQALADILVDYLRQNGLEQPLLERQVVEAWPQVMGAATARMTRENEMKDGFLRVKIKSAALRSQLFECRYTILRKLNERVGGNVVKEIRFL